MIHWFSFKDVQIVLPIFKFSINIDSDFTGAFAATKTTESRISNNLDKSSEESFFRSSLFLDISTTFKLIILIFSLFQCYKTT